MPVARGRHRHRQDLRLPVRRCCVRRPSEVIVRRPAPRSLQDQLFSTRPLPTVRDALKAPAEILALTEGPRPTHVCHHFTPAWRRLGRRPLLLEGKMPATPAPCRVLPGTTQSESDKGQSATTCAAGKIRREVEGMVTLTRDNCLGPGLLNRSSRQCNSYQTLRGGAHGDRRGGRQSHLFYDVMLRDTGIAELLHAACNTR